MTKPLTMEERDRIKRNLELLKVSDAKGGLEESIRTLAIDLQCAMNDLELATSLIISLCLASTLQMDVSKAIPHSLVQNFLQQVGITIDLENQKEAARETERT